jgi:hypothetical protein
MDKADLNEDVIRAYLLGRLSENDALLTQIDERSFTEVEFSALVGLVEDEILEEYLEGALSADDREACERHFLRPPERRQKLRDVQLLNRHLAAISAGPYRAKRLDRRQPSLSRGARILSFPHARTYAELAAAILFAIGIAYHLRLRSEVRNEFNEGRQELARERQQNADLNRQPVTSEGPPSARTATLSLLRPGTLRGDAQEPQLSLGPTAGNIHTEVALPAGASGMFAVQVVCSGKPVWSHGPIGSRMIQGGTILGFDFPARALSAGGCQLDVRHVDTDAISYLFRVSDLQ